MKYGRMVYIGDDVSIFSVFNTLSEAQDGHHSEARGRGAYGPIYTLTGEIFEPLNVQTVNWKRREL